MGTVVGAPVHLTAAFVDATGVAADPDSVVLVLNLPDGTASTFGGVRDSAGHYHYDYTPLLQGTYDFYFVGTGANAATQPVDVFTVEGLTSGALISIADAKETLNKAVTSLNPSSTDDSEIRGFIHSASFVVNYLCGYSRPTTFTEWTTPHWGALVTPTNVYASILVNRLPLFSVQSIAPQFYGATLDLTYIKQDAAAGIIYLPMTSLAVGYLGPVAVTYQAGRSSVPSVLQQATRLIVQNLWETQRGPASKAMFGGDETVMVPGLGQYIPTRAWDLMRYSPYYAAPAMA